MSKSTNTKLNDNSLFALPEYQMAFLKFTDIAINELTRRKSSILNLIPFEKVEEVPTMQYTLPSGEVLEHEPVNTIGEATIFVDSLLSGNLDSYYVLLDEVSNNAYPQLEEQFFSHANEVLDGYGNSVNAMGKSQTPELILQMFERKEFLFDENGNFTKGEALIFKTQTGEFCVQEYSTPEQLKNLLKIPPEYEQAFNDLIERKRQEFYARKRTRKLS